MGICSRLSALAWLAATGMAVGQADSKNPLSDSYFRRVNVMQRMMDPVNMRSGSIPSMLPPAAAEVKGDVYLAPDYRITTFVLYDNDKLIEGYASKYDINKNEFDLMTQQGVRVLPGNKVKSLVWLDSLTKQPQYFFNYQDVKNEQGVPYLGFFQLLSDGTFPLLKKTELIFKKADFNPALNVGSKDHRYIKKPHYFVVKDDKMMELPGRKIPAVFPDHQEDIQKFVKKNSLDLSHEGHLVALFDYYNSLTKN